ncbi:fibronectin type III domain-containing protein [Actinosynnema sp. NPDC059335]|uniref:fibronectin type III domain-containing protein n=1 Tax=Actinosynnema sp. NPDC059335 TaxID=3346804 RepID=UPI00366ABE10
MTSKRSAARASQPFVLLAVVCVAVAGAVLAGVTPPLSAARFANTGHWVYNSVLGVVFHLDGATAHLDAEFPIDAEVGSRVLQGDTGGWVVGPNRITGFDKESLTPRRSTRSPATGTPVGFEVVGGPYAVYPDSGRIVRLGDPAASIATDGAIGVPVVTQDGTMWFHRTGKGRICTLAKDAVEISGCPVAVPPDHPGALTVVDGRPAFLDLFTSTLHAIEGDALGDGVELGVPLSPTARPAAQDVGGRLAVLDEGTAQSSLVLVDTTTTPARSVTVALGAGDYDGPVSTGEVVALVDRRDGTVLTYDANGRKKDEEPVGDKAGEPRLTLGEDKRVYVEDTRGTQVLVVAEDGSVTNVEVARKPSPSTGTPTAKPADQPAPPDRPTPPDSRPSPDERRQPDRPTAVPPPAPPATPEPPPPVPPSRPGAPTAVTARPGNGWADVGWGPAPDNRAPITAYLVTWQGSNGHAGSAQVGGGERGYRAGGLANGVGYTFTVAATNQAGTGPGATSGPVTPIAPVSPAGAPVGLRADYDVDDRPTRDVTLTWGQPPLNGGVLVHYEVTATGLGAQRVTGTQVVYPQVEAARAVTFTVFAVTRTPDGQTLTGAPASVTHEADAGARINASGGAPCGDRPDCAARPYDNPGRGAGTDADGTGAFEAFAHRDGTAAVRPNPAVRRSGRRRS